MTFIFLDYIVPASVLIPLLVLLPAISKAPPYIRWLFVYLLSTAVVNAAGVIMALNAIPNLWLIHFYTVIETFLLLCFFRCLIRGPFMLKIVQVMMYIFPLFCIINFLFLQSINNFNTYIRPLEAILFIMLSMAYWWQDHEETNDVAWWNIPANWMITGVMLYFSAAFSLFLFSNYLHELVAASGRRTASIIAWHVHAALVLLMYTLFTIGFLKWKK